MSKKNKGLWLDHREAFIVTLANGQETLEHVESNVERHTRAAGGSPSPVPWGQPDVMNEDAYEHKFQAQLKKYFEEVASYLEDADAVYIFGPAEAKIELQKFMEEEGKAENIVAVETTDKMTENQMKAKVREKFEK